MIISLIIIRENNVKLTGRCQVMTSSSQAVSYEGLIFSNKENNTNTIAFSNHSMHLSKVYKWF